MEKDFDFKYTKRNDTDIVSSINKSLERDVKVRLFNEFIQDMNANKIYPEVKDYEIRIDELLRDSKYISVKDEIKKELPNLWEFYRIGFTPTVSFDTNNKMYVSPTLKVTIENTPVNICKLLILTHPKSIDEESAAKLRTPKLDELLQLVSKDNEIWEIFAIILNMFQDRALFAERNNEYLIQDLKKLYLLLTEEQKKTFDKYKNLRKISLKAGIKFKEYYPEYEKIYKEKLYSQQEKDFVYKLGYDKFNTRAFAFIVLAYRHRNENEFTELFCDETFDKLDVSDLNNLLYFAEKFYNSYTH